MNRRDFLFLRRERDLRVVELSCRTLYMRCLDAQITGAESDEAGGALDPWGHEPQAVLSTRTAEDLFETIRASLSDVDVLRLVDRAWVSDGDLNARLVALADAFAARGGRVEWSPEP